MPHATQPDLFGVTPQPAPSYLPDPAKVREKVLAILAKAKAAPEAPWRDGDREYYRLVLPQMTNWLPEDEAGRLRGEFAAELARLTAA